MIVDGATVKPRVAELRRGFLELQYCFRDDDLEDRLAMLHTLY